MICRQLGYTNAEKATLAASFGGGSGVIWLDDVMCDGTEPSIFTCPSSEWGDHNCEHTEDAGVICTDDGKHQVEYCNVRTRTNQGYVPFQFNV